MLPALIVGALTAWYLGIRAGVIAAGVTFGVLMLGMFVPGVNLAVYAVVLAWCAALYFLGPKMSKQGSASLLNGGMGQAAAWVRKLVGKDK